MEIEIYRLSALVVTHWILRERQWVGGERRAVERRGERERQAGLEKKREEGRLIGREGRIEKERHSIEVVAQ